MDYILVINRSKVEFIQEVKGLLGEGWELQGGVGVNGNFYCQAMVKPDELENQYIAGYLKVTKEMLKDLPDPRSPDPEIMKAAWTPPKLTGTTPHVQNEKPKRSHKKKT